MSAGKWDYSHGPRVYGPNASYLEAAKLLDRDGWTVADWGCGCCAAKKYFHRAKYIGIDGSPGFAERVADLREYREPSDGILLRHVLEHNYDWPSILRNALASARKRVVIVLFLSMKRHTELYAIDQNGIPALHISEEIFASLMPHKVTPLILPRSDESPHKEEWVYVVDKVKATPASPPAPTSAGEPEGDGPMEGDVESTIRIGQYLKRTEWRDPYVASDRIRGEWIMKYCPEMEEWRPGRRYDAVVFHNPVKEIASAPGVKLLDVCDLMWQRDPDGFRRTAMCVDGIVTATDELKRQVTQLVFKPTVTIGDGHHFPFYETRAWNPHQEPARRVVWFGYADNAFSLNPLMSDILGRHHLELTVIAERNPFPQSGGVRFVPWRVDTYVNEISKADFAVLPLTQPYKSNNKDVSALLSGVPVAKTASDIERLLDPDERRRDMLKAPEVVSLHCARDRAREYMGLIRSLVDRK